MSTEFTPIGLEQQASYRARLKQCPTVTSDYSFVNLWSWAQEYELSWAWTDDLVWIRQQQPETCYWAPVGPWERIDWGKVLTRPIIGDGRFIRIPKRLLDLWRQHRADNLDVEEARDQWDYLYRVEELIALKGNRFHKKRNLLNQFKKKYDFTYHPFESTLVHMALDMQQDWCTWRDCEAVDALAAENRVIAKVLDNWDQLTGLTGGGVIVNDQMVAYTIAETLTDGTLLIHFEKGDPAFKGVYQAINQLFLEQTGSEASLVNREQDLGDAGLRKAKLSYHPVDFLKKYRVNLS
jgi:hypothetical protein